MKYQMTSSSAERFSLFEREKIQRKKSFDVWLWLFVYVWPIMYFECLGKKSTIDNWPVNAIKQIETSQHYFDWVIFIRWWLLDI